MDLKDLKPTKSTIEVTLVHPLNGEVLTNKDDSPMTISLYAPYSREYKEVMYERADERIKQAKSKGKDQEFTAKDVDESSIDILARTTASWSITYDGKKPRLTVEKAREIYTELFWIRPQIDKAIDEDKVFT